MYLLNIASETRMQYLYLLKMPDFLIQALAVEKLAGALPPNQDPFGISQLLKRRF
jgi:hypothetical protein